MFVPLYLSVGVSVREIPSNSPAEFATRYSAIFFQFLTLREFK